MGDRVAESHVADERTLQDLRRVYRAEWRHSTIDSRTDSYAFRSTLSPVQIGPLALGVGEFNVVIVDGGTVDSSGRRRDPIRIFSRLNAWLHEAVDVRFVIH